MQLLVSEVSAGYYAHLPGILRLLTLTITNIQGIALYIHTQCMLNSHTVHSLHMIIVMATSVMGEMNMGNIVPRVGLKPTCWTFPTSYYVGSLMSPLDLSMYLLASEVSADFYICLKRLLVIVLRHSNSISVISRW